MTRMREAKSIIRLYRLDYDALKLFMDIQHSDQIPVAPACDGDLWTFREAILMD